MSRTYCFMLIFLFSIIGIFFLPYFALKAFCILLLSALLFLSIAIAIKSSIPKYLFITLFSLALPISLLEAYLTLNHVEVTYIGENPFEKHANLGHALIPNKTFARKLLFDKEVVYDVKYSIDDKRHRVTPMHENAKIAVLLMGGSFTFGQGINDTETFAYKLAQNLGQNYQVINFGVPAYGPHQMLAEIEAGLPYLQKYDQILTYYTYIKTHEVRAAGSKRDQSNGPRYVLENGKAIRKGQFDQDPAFFWESGFWLKLEGNKLFENVKKFLLPQLLPYNTDKTRMQLTQAIVEKSASEIAKINKNSMFSVLVWPPNAFSMFSPDWKTLPNIPVIDMSKWLPDSEQNMQPYRLKDIHPNAHAADLVAQELTKLVKEDTAKLIAK